jgi:hypothetical protein
VTAVENAIDWAARERAFGAITPSMRALLVSAAAIDPAPLSATDATACTVAPACVRRRLLHELRRRRGSPRRFALTKIGRAYLREVQP